MISKSEMKLLEQYIDGTLADDDVENLRTLLRNNPKARSTLRSMATIDFGLQDLSAGWQADERQVAASSIGKPQADFADVKISQSSFLRKTLPSILAIAATLFLAFMAGRFIQNAGVEDFTETQQQTEKAELQALQSVEIARVKGMGGPVVWTGNGGHVSNQLEAGDSLTGGTIEGTTPNSWLELEFTDGSTIMISGDSRLTFSDDGQKRLHVKDGVVSASVSPQPAGKPMLLNTRSAQLEVLGTRFKVETDISSTSLNVSEGKVRVERLSDGKSVEVSANHRVVASVEDDLLPESIPDSTNTFSTRFEDGPRRTLGTWSPRWTPDGGRDGSILRSVFYVHTASNGETFANQTVSSRVSGGGHPPVILDDGAAIRVRGRIGLADGLVVGITVSREEDGFHGNFFAFVPANDLEMNSEFDLVVDVEDLVASSDVVESEIGVAPFDSVIESVWCNTPGERPGLEVYEFELGAISGD